ncbi:MAG TPA: carboxylating nicotinate-nucleotide diphosphorylase [Thiolapillus brandeum]|uniref:Probable nicotinate-nucleotide pyrophosphorylase [carboxylating] n=1 Tax=Thiolapillus brandeum TaxID=1076588 RepID=A0A831K3L6_9GAMM|nr:carboxylating nicotinate-nucleotide diphosphorylase [Thiolapillus brandeum]
MLPERKLIESDVQRALAEDIGDGDLTAALVPLGKVRAQIISRQQAVLSGTAWLDEVYRQVDAGVELQWHVSDGDNLQENQLVCTLYGNGVSILTAERTGLNFLQTLSGTATLTASYVAAVQGTGVNILDTRKTLPGLRLAQKYAVACGGGVNHRMGLYDAILIKENHIAAAGSIPAVLERARTLHPEVPLEIEVENLDELQTALAAGAKRVLLDNFSLQQLHEAVTLNQGRARLEASGGVSLQNIRAIAETGVDDISVGALTKDLQAVDFSLMFQLVQN